MKHMLSAKAFYKYKGLTWDHQETCMFTTDGV